MCFCRREKPPIRTTTTTTFPSVQTEETLFPCGQRLEGPAQGTQTISYYSVDGTHLRLEFEWRG